MIFFSAQQEQISFHFRTAFFFTPPLCLPVLTDIIMPESKSHLTLASPLYIRQDLSRFREKPACKEAVNENL